eukprot:TRINITY_DN64277_c0_g1_i1.p1 TRINITY_DN64277_c0_g1~~TRINITY_DN64277_c0_g1_i1.p1  ORF type:complete len:573 (+),score=66.45 TRINITY_DN64277_c0_g1_i1:50-1720(+)
MIGASWRLTLGGETNAGSGLGGIVRRKLCTAPRHVGSSGSWSPPTSNLCSQGLSSSCRGSRYCSRTFPQTSAMFSTSPSCPSSSSSSPPLSSTAPNLLSRHHPYLIAVTGDRRSFCAGSKSDDSSRPSKPVPIDITTALDEHRKLRHVERRIEDHLAQSSRQDATEVGEQKQLSSRPIDCGSSVSADNKGALSATPLGSAAAPVRSSEALRVGDYSAAVEAVDGESKDIVRSRTTTGQVLWPATQEDIDILSDSKLLYPAPYEVEGSVIIRLVRLSDPVTSPVGRVIRNRQFGIRGNEKWQLLAMGALSCLLIYCLGFWQLRRMEWKRNLIELRRTRLSMNRLQVATSPFPWRDKVEDYLYRTVEVRGVFDHNREMLVGPRPGTNDAGETVVGWQVVTPLRLEDGSKVLVNRGHIPADRADFSERPEQPTWVRVRGVLEEGEIANVVGDYARLKNRPDRKQWIYVVAEDLAENAGARNHRECASAVLTAFDVLYEDDFQAGYRRETPYTMRHKEDYLLFWADEHTHFNYAMQWFGMGTLIMVMTVYKFIEVSNWRF